MEQELEAVASINRLKLAAVERFEILHHVSDIERHGRSPYIERPPRIKADRKEAKKMDEQLLCANWIQYVYSNLIPILALIATAIIALASLLSVCIARENYRLSKELVTQQLKLEKSNDERIAWEHIANYAPWLWITLKPGKLREQINWGPIVKFDAVDNKSYSARIFGYKVNSIDLSESLENFQISRKSNGRPCKSLEGRLSNKPDLCSSLLDEAVESFKRAVQMATEYWEARDNLRNARLPKERETYIQIHEGNKKFVRGFDIERQVYGKSDLPGYYYFDLSAYLIRGYPGHRNLPGKSGYNPMDLYVEQGYMAGLLL